jgi:transcriptional regulator with XRE-family HTH domain
VPQKRDLTPPRDDDKQAIASALRDHDGPQARRAMARALGVTVSQVSRWYRGMDRMTPRQVFAAEAALGLEPGTLSAAAGFAPIGTPPGVVAAIRDDRRLGERDRRILQLLYREMVRDVAVPLRRLPAAKRRTPRKPA